MSDDERTRRGIERSLQDNRPIDHAAVQLASDIERSVRRREDRRRIVYAHLARPIGCDQMQSRCHRQAEKKQREAQQEGAFERRRDRGPNPERGG